MPELSFHIRGVVPSPYAASPQLTFALCVTNAVAEEPIYSVTLRCQIQIEATRRRYSPQAQERLLDLFGAPERWSHTLHNMLWTHVSIVVPPFTGHTMVELPVPCTFDFNVAAAKYFAGLEDGDVPLNLLFSGTVFYAAEGGALQVAQISWDQEVRYRLSVPIWQEMIERYYPNSAWLCLRRDVFERFYQYKRRHGLLTWEQAMESLLPDCDPELEKKAPS